jgi:CubicO group peptidase (beta-lactamase class C family)
MSTSADAPSMKPHELSLYEVQDPIAGKIGEEAKVQRLREILGTSDMPAKHLDAALLKLGMQDFTSAKAEGVASRVIIGSLSEAQRTAIEEMDHLTLERWLAVRDVFRQAKEELANCAPDGCAAYARLVLPENVELAIGKLELCVGKTGSKGGKKVDEDTLANIGSSGKPITAIMAAVLEHGKYLRFTDSIGRYFPKEAMAKFQQDCNGMPVSPEAITVDMLASMTAGLTYESLAGVEATRADLSTLSQDELLRRPTSRKIPFMSVPGDGICTYSNLQMQLLAYVIEKAYKEKALKTLLQGNPELAARTLGSFLENGGGGFSVDQLPQRVLDMSLRDFERVVSDPARQDAYDDKIDSNVYIHDLIDVILAHEGHRAPTFDKILAKELFQPLGIRSATYAPDAATKQTGRVLTIGKPTVLARGEGEIPPHSSLIFGAGDLFMSPTDETRFIRALMSPAVVDAGTGRELVSPEQVDWLFTSRNQNLPSWAVGGISVERGDFSVSVEKGGSLDEYHHNFRWERVVDPSNRDRAIGRFMWDNFIDTPGDRHFCRSFGRLYEKAVSILQSEVHPTAQASDLQLKEPPTFSEAEEKDLLPHPERIFLGRAGLVSYSSKNNFLHWKGVPYRIQLHDEHECIVVNDQWVQIRFGEDDKGQKFIQVGEEKVTELPMEAMTGAVRPNGHTLVPDAERYYQGDRGLIAYSKGDFLYWAGVAYNIHTHDNQEYVFIEGRPCPIQTFDGTVLPTAQGETSANAEIGALTTLSKVEEPSDGVAYLMGNDDATTDGTTMSYLQVDEAQVSEISKDTVLEAANTVQMREDLTAARLLLPQLQGKYFGDHEPTATNGTFTVDSLGVLCLKLDEPDSKERPLQLIKVHRDAENRIDELHVDWPKEPPDKMLKFVREGESDWKIEITEFLTGTLCETCTKSP